MTTDQNMNKAVELGYLKEFKSDDFYEKLSKILSKVGYVYNAKVHCFSYRYWDFDSYYVVSKIPFNFTDNRSVLIFESEFSITQGTDWFVLDDLDLCWDYINELMCQIIKQPQNEEQSELLMVVKEFIRQGDMDKTFYWLYQYSLID